jgi:transcriptional regulator with XRE-family HTH domain
LVIRQRLKDLGLEQRELARAAQVTESYISQVLRQRKLPPASGRTDIYEKLERLLKLPAGELARLADLQRREQLTSKLGDPPGPLYREVRELILRKCRPVKRAHLRSVFEKQPFGEVERFVTQKLLDVLKGIAKQELEREPWLRYVARLSHRSYEEMRVIVLEFLDTDIFNLSMESCVLFLDPLIESWDIDLATFAMEITLNRKVVRDYRKRFEFVERDSGEPDTQEPGYTEFLKEKSLSGDAAPEELAYLSRLKFTDRRPTPLYYYRELQSLRDPLHFRLPKARPGAKA